MSKIVAGMDVSGNQDVGNYKFMAIVIGTEDKINSIIQQLEYEHIHMNNIANTKVKNSIISALQFDNREITAFCVRINRDPIIQEIYKIKRKKRHNISRARILRTFNYLLLRELRDYITEFLAKHNYAISDVTFQCDDDCRSFAKDNGLRYADQSNAHMLSDIVAWANNKNMEPKGVISLDLGNVIETKLKTKI